MKKRKVRTIKILTYQTGKRKSIKRDSKLRAAPPGKRKSRPGAKRKYYWETRKNRSDKRGSRL